MSKNLKRTSPFLVLVAILISMQLLHAGSISSPGPDDNRNLNSGTSLISSTDPSPSPDTTLKAVRAAKGPTVDGSLSDPVWQEAIPFSAFTQVFPVTGAPPTEKTELRILYDDDTCHHGT